MTAGVDPPATRLLRKQRTPFQRVIRGGLVKKGDIKCFEIEAGEGLGVFDVTHPIPISGFIEVAEIADADLI